MKCKELIEKLNNEKVLTKEEFTFLLSSYTKEDMDFAAKIAREICDSIYGKDIYLRGLVEVSSYCKNDCYYCGIRASNKNAQRYRLTKDEILECCEEGYALGFKTFVLQGGEDMHFTCDVVCDIVREIKKRYPECAVTLSLGEKPYEEYKAYKQAGADRYLLRHETASEKHYSLLHPEKMLLSERKRCLWDLKSLGFQTGAGMMVGAPYQTAENLAEDMLYLHDLKPQMVGIGPFIPHKDTPFRDMQRGSFELTVFLLSLVRIMLPDVLLPATTALGTIHPKGREIGVLAGANVIMPNLSPLSVRKKYMLYEGKICTGDESAQSVISVKKKMESIGYRISFARGNYKGI